MSAVPDPHAAWCEQFDAALAAMAHAGNAWLHGLYGSECGHDQGPPTQQDIDGCSEVIVRECADCGVPLWWNIDRWRKV